MTDIRRRLEELISDSGMFRAGQQDERLRLCHLLDIRLDELAKLPRNPHVSARREELLTIRQSLNPHP
jgi:hypothetical protein